MGSLFSFLAGANREPEDWVGEEARSGSRSARHRWWLAPGGALCGRGHGEVSAAGTLSPKAPAERRALLPAFSPQTTVLAPAAQAQSGRRGRAVLGRSVQGEGGPWGSLPPSGRSTRGCAGSHREATQVLAWRLASGSWMWSQARWDPLSLVRLEPGWSPSHALLLRHRGPAPITPLLTDPASPLSPVLHTCPSGYSPLGTKGSF